MGLLWADNRPITNISIWKHTILLREIIHAHAGIRNRNSNKRASDDPRLRPRSHYESLSNNWDISQKSLSWLVLWIYSEKSEKTNKSSSKFLVPRFGFETQTIRTQEKTVHYFTEEWFLNSNNLYTFDRNNYCGGRCKVSGKGLSFFFKFYQNTGVGFWRKWRKSLSGKPFFYSRQVDNYGT